MSAKPVDGVKNQPGCCEIASILTSPRMYPFSLTDCSVGRFIRNFISLVRTRFGSVSPAELDECVTLCLEAEKFQTFIDALVALSNWVKPADVTRATYIDACQPRLRGARPEPPPRWRRSSRTGLRLPRQRGGPGTPGGRVNPGSTLSTSHSK